MLFIQNEIRFLVLMENDIKQVKFILLVWEQENNDKTEQEKDQINYSSK